MILGNPTFAGTILAFFLDNTVPGNASLVFHRFSSQIGSLCVLVIITLMELF